MAGSWTAFGHASVLCPCIAVVVRMRPLGGSLARVFNRLDRSEHLMQSSIAAALGQFAFNIAMDARDSFTRRFGFAGNGLFIHLPFTSRSLWIEWREQSVGFGINRTAMENIEFFAWRIQGVLSAEGAR